MPEMETATFETDLSLFKYDNLEQLPPAYRDLDEEERTGRIEAALDELGDDVVWATTTSAGRLSSTPTSSATPTS